MEFDVLGPLEVRQDGRTVTPGSPVLRRLLAVLLCQVNHPVLTGSLAEVLWLGSPPPGARKTLQVYVHRLRQQLGRPRIMRQATGYLLVAEPTEVDAARFGALVERARSAQRERAYQEAYVLFDQALSLWRGEPYADITTTGLIADEVERLTEQRLLILEEMAGAGLDSRHHAELVPQLQQLAKAYPFREQFQALLMLALYRCSRQSEALEVFRSARATLSNELGVEPDVTLQRLHEAMLRADERLTHVASGSLVEEWEPSPLLLGSPPAAEPAAPQQLPLAVVGFSGRQSQLRQLNALLDVRRDHDELSGRNLAAITGTAGVGKTALAVQWAHRMASRFPDGQLYVDMRGFDPSGQPVSQAEAVRRFLDALAVPASRIPTSLEAQLGTYRSVLAGKRVLVLLDNARDAAHARPLLPGSPWCMTLVTSRDPLSGLIAAEGASSIRLDLFTPQEGRELLARRLGSGRTLREPEAVDDLVDRCARLPLALAIVAARAVAHPDHPLQEIAAELARSDGDLTVFTTGEQSTDVRSVLSWSYNTLSVSAARLFRHLSVNPGPDISTAAAAGVASTPLHVAREDLTELVRSGLVIEPTPGRYTFHDLVRTYAAELTHTHDSAEHRQAALHRMLDHYLHSAYSAYKLLYATSKDFVPSRPRPGTTATEFVDGEQAYAWFRNEHPVLVSVVRKAADSGFDSHSWLLVRVLGEFLERSGCWYEWIATQHTVLEAAQRLGDRSAEALAHRMLGRAYSRLGREAAALGNLEQALTLYTELDHRVGQARTHGLLAGMFRRRGGLTEAVDQSLRAFALFQAANDRLGMAYALNEVGWYYGQSGDYYQALKYCRQALEVNTDVGDATNEAGIWDSLGYIFHHIGRYRKATSCYQQSLRLYEKLDDRYQKAQTLHHLAETQGALGDSDGARRTLTAALQILDDLGHRDAEAVRAELQRHL